MFQIPGLLQKPLFKGVALLSLAGVSYSIYQKCKTAKPSVAIINLCGVIEADVGGGMPFSQSKSINLENIEEHIDKAFKVKELKEVYLLINSPGGSPVQSDLIAKKIIHLREKNNIRVVSFAEDIAASGGYWLACAGNEIYAGDNSIVGSIGVIHASFGFHELIKQYNVERRVHTMGRNKSMMDPFRPETEADKEIMQRALKRTYDNFISYVKGQRGDRLKADDDMLFTGEIWVGSDAVEVGLVDGIKTMNEYIYEKYGDDVNIVRVNPNKPGGLLKSLLLSSISSLFLMPRFGIEDGFDKYKIK